MDDYRNRTLLIAGDAVILTVGRRRIPALVQCSVAHGRSLVVAFEGGIGPWVGIMPILQDGAGQWAALDGLALEVELNSSLEGLA